MRISELSLLSGVPVHTIKYYLREGLLPRGDATAPNQAEYGEDHLRRLRLIRAMIEVGGLSLAATRDVLAALDDPDLPLHEVFGAAHTRLRLSSRIPTSEDELDAALVEIDRYLKRRRWKVSPDSPPRRELAEALVVLRRLGRNVTTDAFDPYADVADQLAAWEIDQVAQYVPKERRVEAVVVGTVVYDVVLSALRRLAEEHHSSGRFRRRSRTSNASTRARAAGKGRKRGRVAGEEAGPHSF